MRTQAVYKIENIKNGKTYVGSSVGVERRWNTHRKLLITGRHHSCILQREWQKYGAENFRFSILEEVAELSTLRMCEKEWIKKLDSVRTGYNRIYDTEVKLDKLGSVKRIYLDKNGKIQPSSLSRNDNKELKEVGQVVFLRQLKARGCQVEIRFKKAKKRKRKESKQNKKGASCLVWAKNPEPYIIRS